MAWWRRGNAGVCKTPTAGVRFPSKPHLFRRRARVVDWTGLENQHGRKVIGGSNPSVSAFNFMFKRISTILIWSSDYKKLAEWYTDKLGLKKIDELNHPKDTGIRFAVGESNLWIGRHSKVKGKNKNIHRHMFNIEVDSVTQSYKRLKFKGVKFLATPFKAPTFNKYFATFYDLDNNLIQLIGNK